jgi:hypothetical protein
MVLEDRFFYKTRSTIASLNEPQVIKLNPDYMLKSMKL